MSDIIKRDLDPESSVVSTAHRCGMWLLRHNLRCSANLFLISSIRLFIALRLHRLTLPYASIL